MVVEQILTEAMHLPKPSRAFMAEKLLESLDYEEDFTIPDEWLEEIHRRITEIDAGRMKMIPAAQVFTSIRRSLRQ